MASKEKEFWHNQVELPGFLVMTKLKKAQEYVEEDAPIAHAPMIMYTPLLLTMSLLIGRVLRQNVNA